VVRFTAPNAGAFNITGSFTDLQMSSVDLSILINGVTVFNASFTGSSPYQGSIPFSIKDVRLTPGMTWILLPTARANNLLTMSA
jgi:hypothetical protein